MSSETTTQNYENCRTRSLSQNQRNNLGKLSSESMQNLRPTMDYLHEWRNDSANMDFPIN